MGVVRNLTSRTELKQRTSRDVRNVGPIVGDFEKQVSTAGQTEITLNNFVVKVDSNGIPVQEGSFNLYIDGKKLTAGALNDFVFTAIENSVSRTISLNSSLADNLNIQIEKVGVTRENFPNPSSVAADLLGIQSNVNNILAGQVSIVNYNNTNTDLEISDSGKVILCDSTSGNINLAMPAASDCDNLIFFLKKTVAANLVTLTLDGADELDGKTYAVELEFVGDYIKIVSDGSNWQILDVQQKPKIFTRSNTGITGTGIASSLDQPAKIGHTYVMGGTFAGEYSTTSNNTKISLVEVQWDGGAEDFPFHFFRIGDTQQVTVRSSPSYRFTVTTADDIRISILSAQNVTHRANLTYTEYKPYVEP